MCITGKLQTRAHDNHQLETASVKIYKIYNYGIKHNDFIKKHIFYRYRYTHFCIDYTCNMCSIRYRYVKLKEQTTRVCDKVTSWRLAETSPSPSASVKRKLR